MCEVRHIQHIPGCTNLLTTRLGSHTSHMAPSHGQLSIRANWFHSGARMGKHWYRMYSGTRKWHFWRPFCLSVCVSVYLFTLTHLAGNSSMRETAWCYITVIVPPTHSHNPCITVVALHPLWLQSDLAGGLTTRFRLERTHTHPHTYTVQSCGFFFFFLSH